MIGSSTSSIEDGKVMQDFDLESLPTEGEHSQMVKDPYVGKDSGSKSCINLPSSTAVSRIILDCAKGPGLNDCKEVHISNIDPFTIAQSRDFRAGPNYQSKLNRLYQSQIEIFLMGPG